MADLGQQALQKVYKDLQIDEQWSTCRDRAFSWIAHRLEQTVSASTSVQDDEIMLYRLVAETEVVEGVDAPEAVVERTLSELNRFAFGNCYSYLPQERRICATASTWIHSGTIDWRTPIFGMHTIGQLSFAEAEADYLAARCNGRVAIRPHPRSGRRDVPDDMLNAVDDVFTPVGLEPSRYRNEFEFQAVADMAKQSDYAATLGASANGIALECSFGDYTAISILSSDTGHRRLGAGLTEQIQLPDVIDQEDGARIAAALNRHERDSGPWSRHAGAWFVDAGPTGKLAVTYRGFLPNWIYRSGLTMDAATACIGRMRWADLKLNAKPSPKSAWKLLADRFGFRRKEE